MFFLRLVLYVLVLYVLVCVCFFLLPKEGRVVSQVRLQSVLQWISQLHLVQRQSSSFGAVVRVSDLQDAAHLHAQQ